MFRSACGHMQGKLHGVIMCENSKMMGLKTEAVAWSPDVKKAIALCHDLVPLSKGKLTGQLEDKKAFVGVEAAFLVCLLIPVSRIANQLA